MDSGFRNAIGKAVAKPLPISWLGRADAPLSPTVLTIPQLTATNIKNLQAQIGYDLSQWDYSLIGTDNQLGRYQFSTKMLETYGLLAPGSNLHYGTDCVNYSTCWRPITIRKNSNSYADYNYNITSLNGFLTSIASQEHLAYQLILDIYTGLIANYGIVSTDTADIVAGMIYVGWTLGVADAYSWRYSALGDGINSFNSGRYAVTVLG